MEWHNIHVLQKKKNQPQEAKSPKKRKYFNQFSSNQVSIRFEIYTYIMQVLQLCQSWD